MGDDVGPKIQGILQEIDLCFRAGLDCAFDDRENKWVEREGVGFHGVHQASQDRENGLFHQVFVARLLPERWQEADNPLGEGRDVMLQAFHYDRDCVQQSHLRLRKLNIVNQLHHAAEDCFCVREEMLGLELPVIRDVLKLPTCGHAHNLIVQRLAFFGEKVLEDLEDQRPAFVRDLHRDPLAQ